MATKITITIRTENAAFGGNPVPEVSRILRKLSRNLEIGGDLMDVGPFLADINGNNTGTVVVCE